MRQRWLPHHAEYGPREELVETGNAGEAAQVSPQSEPSPPESDPLEMFALEGGGCENLAELADGDPVEEFAPVLDVPVWIRTAFPGFGVEPVERGHVVVGVVDVRGRCEERLHRNPHVRPREWNNVLQVGAVRAEPWMEMDEILAARPEHAVALPEDLLRAAEVLDGVDGVDDIQARIGERNRGRRRLHETDVRIFPGSDTQHFWVAFDPDGRESLRFQERVQDIAP